MKGNLLHKEIIAKGVVEAMVFLAEAKSTTGALLSVDGRKYVCICKVSSLFLYSDRI